MPTSIRELPIPGAVLFDLDGTLVDTAPDLIGSLNVLFARERLAQTRLGRRLVAGAAFNDGEVVVRLGAAGLGGWMIGSFDGSSFSTE